MRHRRLITQLILLTVVVGAQFACPRNREPSKVKDVRLDDCSIASRDLSNDIWYAGFRVYPTSVADDQWEVNIQAVDLKPLSLYSNPVYLTIYMSLSIIPPEGFRLHGIEHDGYVVKAYQNGERVPTSPYLRATMSLGSDSATFHFPLNFNDPTYQTAETHTYRVDFYNCSEDCAGYEDNKALGLADRVTVTVSYTP